MKARVYVTMKQGILDPQGKAIQASLQSLGYDGVREVRAGRYLEIELADCPREAAMTLVRELCDRLLANPVIEEYRFELD